MRRIITSSFALLAVSVPVALAIPARPRYDPPPPPEAPPACYALVVPGLEAIAAEEIAGELRAEVKRTAPGDRKSVV